MIGDMGDIVDFAIKPFSFVGVPLCMIGLAGTAYLLSAREKTPATRYLTGALAAFTLAALALLADGVHLWGGAFGPLQDTLTAIALVGMVRFVCRFPERPGGRQQRGLTLVKSFGIVIGVGSLLCSLVYVAKSLSLRPYNTGTDRAFRVLVPVAYAAALIASTRRTLSVHRTTRPPASGESTLRWAWQALGRPAPPHAGVLRDFSPALSFGLLLGAAAALTAR